MDIDSTRQLNELNKRFYERVAQSFSQTRQAGWPGWQRVLECLPHDAAILDVACGNMRFERYVLESMPDFAGSFSCVDANSALPIDLPRSTFLACDVIDELTTGGRDPLFGEGLYDVAVCFGFLHHVPGEALRCELLRHILRAVRPKGLIAVSFWGFMRDARMFRKAHEATSRAVGVSDGEYQLEAGDYLLGWQDDPCALRYCHSFTDDEVSRLVCSLGDAVCASEFYRADGKGGDMNSYALLTRA